MNYLLYITCFLVEISRKMNVDTIYTCPNIGCRNSFKYRIQRGRHMKKCEKAKPDKVSKIVKNYIGSYNCKKCSKVIKHRNNVNIHLNLCNGKENIKETVCSVCGKIFQFPSKFQVHMRVLKKLPHQYQVCDKSLKGWTICSHIN